MRRPAMTVWPATGCSFARMAVPTIVLFSVIACGGDGSSSSPTSPSTTTLNVTGSWRGTANSSIGLSVQIALSVTQSGSSISGTFSCSSFSCIFSTGTISGSLSGNSVRGSISSSTGGGCSTFNGTVNGDQFTGTYACQTPLSSDQGTFSLTRSGTTGIANPDSSTFVGSWINADVNTMSITRVIINVRSNSLAVHMWGRCHPSDCDWGEVQTSLSDASDGELVLFWDHGYAERRQRLRVGSDGLMTVATHTHYKDGSERLDNDRTDVFTRSAG